MATLDRITQEPDVMGGKPCIRGMRVTVGMIVGQIAAGHSSEEILADYPYLEREDILQALRYAAWRSEEREITLSKSSYSVAIGSERHKKIFPESARDRTSSGRLSGFGMADPATSVLTTTRSMETNHFLFFFELR